MDTTYNPLAEAAKVAIAELNSDKARRFYSLKVQRDTQEAIEFSLTVIRALYLVGRFAYGLGYIAGEWHHAAITAIVRVNDAKPLVLSGNRPVALLPATSGKSQRLPSRTRPVGESQRLPSRTRPVGESLMTRPSAEILDSLTVRQLRGLLRRAGLRPKSGARKAELRVRLVHKH